MLVKALFTLTLSFVSALPDLAQSRFGGPAGLDDAAYTVLSHADLPNHKLRIRAHSDSSVAGVSSAREDLSKYCKGATSGYTGYLSTDNDTKHFYFVYFQSRGNPKEDPLVMWINGGPGCSSMVGLFVELGPCRLTEDGSDTEKNENSWVEAANVFFLDQPLGVGFSYDSSGAPSNGTFAASEDIYAFMTLWYAQFPESRKAGFSIAGESYAGHYIPIFANHIVEQNELAVTEGRNKDVIPIETVMIGNGIFDPLHQASTSWDISCTNVTGIGPLLNDTTCREMEKHIQRCETLWQACYDYPDKMICRQASNYCEKHLDEPFINSGRNYYDISKPCVGNLCYPFDGYITKYLNRQEVRDAMGVDKAVKRYDTCNDKVFKDFNKVGDGYLPTTTYTTNLLNKGLRVLMYVGSYDWICNFVGNERFLLDLPWKYDYGYRHAATYEQEKWVGGEWWEHRNLRYARIHGAGHMVPYDKPEASLHMVKTWLADKPLSNVMHPSKVEHGHVRDSKDSL